MVIVSRSPTLIFIIATANGSAGISRIHQWHFEVTGNRLFLADSCGENRLSVELLPRRSGTDERCSSAAHAPSGDTGGADGDVSQNLLEYGELSHVCKSTVGAFAELSACFTLITSHKSIRKQLMLFVAEPEFPMLDLITSNRRIQRM